MIDEINSKINTSGFVIISSLNLNFDIFSKINKHIDHKNFKRIEKTRFVHSSFTDELRELYLNKEMIDIAKSCLSTNDLALYFSRILIKDSKANFNVTPHQDSAYFHGTTKKLSFFLFPKGNSFEKGGLTFVRDSHKYSLMPKGNIPIDNFNLNYFCPNLTSGDIVVANFHTWHWSNIIKEQNFQRPIIQIVYQDSSCGSFHDMYQDKEVLVCGKWKTKNFFSYNKSKPAEMDNTPIDNNKNCSHNDLFVKIKR